MSEFASTHTAIDMKEQTRATVEAAAKLEGQLIFEQSELDSLKQIYGDENVRVRSARARMAELQHQLQTDQRYIRRRWQMDKSGNPKPAATLISTVADYPLSSTTSKARSSLCGHLSPRACPGDPV